MAKNTRTARTDAPVEILDARAVGSGGRAGRSEPLTGRVDLRDAADPQALGALAWLLDDVIRIPGTNGRIGLDAVIGLVPGIGDSVGAALGSVILIGSVRHRVPMHILLAMAWNILVDTVLGLLPGVGDVADALHRAHRKNYRLLRHTIESGNQVDTDTRGYLLRAGLLVAALIAVLVAVAVWTIWLLLQVLQSLAG